MKESEIQRCILDYLATKGVLAFRMNTGAMAAQHNGRQRFMRFGIPGMADILAFEETIPFSSTHPVWIEVKSITGKQSELQKSFEKQVKDHGHTYILARSVGDVISYLEDK